MVNQDLEEIKSLLTELKNDTQTPKNVREKSENVLKILGSEDEISMNASKAISVFEELTEDPNLEAFIRTQMWNIISLLEKLAL